MTKLEIIKKQFEKALYKLEDVLKQEKNEYIRDSAIQRFEFTFDLSWKLIKAFLQQEGVKCFSPKSCFREAYRNNIIKYDDFWFEMTDWRNQTSHEYEEKMSEKIYSNLPKTINYFKELLNNIK